MRRYTRVAVVQLDYHPAALLNRRSALEDPLFTPGAERGSLTPAAGDPTGPVGERLARLRARVRRVYEDQLLVRVEAILAACRRWEVWVVVFPEYSIPGTLLGRVADLSGDMVVVAGTHSVEREVLAAGAYQALGAPAPAPRRGQAVAPVLYDGRLLALVRKLNPAVPEQRSLVAGDAWAPVELPGGLPSPMGVLVCLDFLFREGEQHQTLVAPALGRCRFLAVPSLTPHYTIPEFGGKAWEEARRYGRPVLYADAASGGGSSVYVDEGAIPDLRAFPDRAGLLDAGDEGVVVADVDLGFDRAGPSTRYEHVPPVLPFAAASLVYRARAAEAAYVTWLDDVVPVLDRADGDPGDGVLDEVERKIGPAERTLLDAGALRGAQARSRRLRRLLSEHQRVTQVEDLRRFTREVVLPPAAVPMRMLRAALARGAAEVLFSWLVDRDAIDAGLGDVETHLRKEGEKIDADEGLASWTDEGKDAVAAVVRAIKQPFEDERAATARTTSSAIAPRVILPEGINPAVLGTRMARGLKLAFRSDPSLFAHHAKPGESVEFSNPGGGAMVWRIHGRDQHPISASEGMPVFSPSRLIAAHEIDVLTRAQNNERVAAVAAWSENAPDASLGVIAASPDRDGGWTLFIAEHVNERDVDIDELIRALAEIGISGCVPRKVSAADRVSQIDALLPRFDGAKGKLGGLRDLLLREVDGHFEEPAVRVGAGEPEPALAALDTWAIAPSPVGLVLGEFGSGKSTLVAEWAWRRWRAEPRSPPLPLVVSLAAAAPDRDAEGLLLDAAGVPDAPAARAALRLLVQHGRLLPCFDGFDELATRIEATELPQRLGTLIAVARDGGKVLVSSRSNYFATDASLRSTVDEALARALGQGAGDAAHLVVEPFDERRIRELIAQVRGGPREAKAAMERISRTYDLADLVRRPLLLGMVLKTLDQLAPNATVGTADVYEAYLGRWLEQTHSGKPECFTDGEKKQFADSLAEQLWRSSEPACGYDELQGAVRARLSPIMRPSLTLEAAFFEIQGGAFFVREGEDRFRFAHKSFLEFFLARALARTLPERPAEALDTRPLTREVVAFLHEILRAREEPATSVAVASVQRFLIERGGTGANAAANGLRLLLGLGRAGGAPAGYVPDGANLAGVDLASADLGGCRLVRARLQGASLAGADLASADLTEAVLDDACLAAARLDQARLLGASARRADLTQAEGSSVDLSGASFEEACLAQAVFVGGASGGIRLAGAEMSACSAPFARPCRTGAPGRAIVDLEDGHGGGVLAVAWAPDGARLASAGDDSTVRIWDARTGNETARLQGHENGVSAVEWAPDGARLASAGYDSTVRIWDARTGNETARLQGHENGVSAVEWAPDGARLASAGYDSTVRIWDARTGNETARLQGHENRVSAVAWAPDGARLASAGFDRTVRIWDARTGKETARLQGHENGLSAVEWAPDGARLASAGFDRTVRIWDARTGKETARLQGHENGVSAVEWAPDSARLASAGNDSTVRIWDARTGKETARLQGHENGVSAVAWAPDGARLASAGDDRTVRIWDARTGKETARLQGHENWVSAVAWAPDGARLASAGDDCTVRIWDARTGNETARLQGHENWVSAVEWAPDGARLASAGYDRTVRIWDARTGKETARLQGHKNWVSAVAWAPDCARLASAGDDSTVRIWDARTGNETARLQGHENGVSAVAWAPDGARLASAGDDSTVRIWDARTGNETARLQGHENGVSAVAWAPDGARLASAGDDSTVRIWDARTGKETARLQGHENGVSAVAWAPDGARLASAGDDSTVRIWDARTGKETARLQGHENWVSAVAWAPDGARLASAGDDSTVRIWDAGRARPLARLEAVRDATLAASAGGFLAFEPDVLSELRLTLLRPEPGALTGLHLPARTLAAALNRPDRVALALTGDLSLDDIAPVLREAGIEGLPSWDGERMIVPAEGVTAPIAAHLTATGRVTGTMVDIAANPFLPGPALVAGDSLPGREDVLADLVALLRRPAPAVLRGPRRAGKTSVLHHLERRLGPSGRVRRLTLEATAIRDAGDLARAIEPALAASAAAAAELRAALAKEKSFLLLDELANLRDADGSAFAWLRAVGQEGTGVLLAGSPWDWHDLVRRARRHPGSSFGNDVTPVDLGPLGRDDALRFLAGTAPADVPIDRDRAATWIVDLCDGWPFYLQVLGFAVVQAARRGDRRALNEPAGVRELYEQRLLRDRDDAYFGGRLAELPEPARAALMSWRTSNETALPAMRDVAPETEEALRACGLADAAGHWLRDRPFFDWVRRIAGRRAGEPRAAEPS